jgi:hypothetical protein
MARKFVHAHALSMETICPVSILDIFAAPYKVKFGCFVFKFHLKVGVEESIVNALHELRINFLNLTFLHEWCVHSRLFNAYFQVKLKKNTRYT